MGWVSWLLFIFVFLAAFSALWWSNIWPQIYLKYHDTLVGKIKPKFFWHKVFLKNSHLCSTRQQNRNLYWIILDEVGSDQSGGILSPFMGTACCSCYPQSIEVVISGLTSVRRGLSWFMGKHYWYMSNTKVLGILASIKTARWFPQMAISRGIMIVGHLHFTCQGMLVVVEPPLIRVPMEIWAPRKGIHIHQ